MKQPEYREGPEALGNFKRLATVILQPPPKKQKKQNYFIVVCANPGKDCGRKNLVKGVKWVDLL